MRLSVSIKVGIKKVAHFKYLQSILLKYDSIRAPIKPTILNNFWKSLRPYILAKLQNKHFKLECFIQIMKKIVVNKAKANLRPWSIIQNIDQYYYQSSQPTYITAAKASIPANLQTYLIKNPLIEKLKLQGQNHQFCSFSTT